MNDQHTLDFQIADTLEKIQEINPDLYGMWYSKLYPPHGDGNYWTAETLAHLNNLLIGKMTKSLPQKTHAETLIKVTEEYTLRPKKGDRVDVCIATLQYLLDNFASDHEYCDEDDCGYSGTYVDADDINHLIYQLKKLK